MSIQIELVCGYEKRDLQRKKGEAYVKELREKYKTLYGKPKVTGYKTKKKSGFKRLNQKLSLKGRISKWRKLRKSAFDSDDEKKKCGRCMRKRVVRRRYADSDEDKHVDLIRLRKRHRPWRSVRKIKRLNLGGKSNDCKKSVKKSCNCGCKKKKTNYTVYKRRANKANTVDTRRARKVYTSVNKKKKTSNCGCKNKVRKSLSYNNKIKTKRVSSYSCKKKTKTACNCGCKKKRKTACSCGCKKKRKTACSCGCKKKRVSKFDYKKKTKKACNHVCLKKRRKRIKPSNNCSRSCTCGCKNKKHKRPCTCIFKQMKNQHDHFFRLAGGHDGDKFEIMANTKLDHFNWDDFERWIHDIHNDHPHSFDNHNHFDNLDSFDNHHNSFENLHNFDDPDWFDLNW